MKSFINKRATERMHDNERFQFNDKHFFLGEMSVKGGSKKVKAESGKVKDDGNKNILILNATTANDFSSTHFYIYPNQIHENIAKFIFMWGCCIVSEEGRMKQERAKIIIFFHNVLLLSLEGKKVSFYYAGK